MCGRSMKLISGIKKMLNAAIRKTRIVRGPPPFSHSRLNISRYSRPQGGGGGRIVPIPYIDKYNICIPPPLPEHGRMFSMGDFPIFRMRYVHKRRKRHNDIIRVHFHYGKLPDFIVQDVAYCCSWVGGFKIEL